ncbi:MAG: hypothetical protein KBD50_00280 [Candidatus Pacebacteria bacterium]|nr:hypothetical protein [Candidatus Paceibacterota bacterium]
MSKIRLLIAYFHAGFMDLAVGVLLINALTAAFGIPFEWWHLPLGAALTVLPDFDIFWPLLRTVFGGTARTEDHHKTWLHFPIVMLPAIGLVGYALGGWEWATITVVGVLAHYIHDAATIKNGGVYWFFRIERTRWTNSEIPTGTGEEWTRKNWLQWSQLSVIETTIGICALLGALAIIALR